MALKYDSNRPYDTAAYTYDGEPLGRTGHSLELLLSYRRPYLTEGEEPSWLVPRR